MTTKISSVYIDPIVHPECVFIWILALCHQGASRMRGRLGSMGSIGSFDRVSVYVELNLQTIANSYFFTLLFLSAAKYGIYTVFPH